MKVLIICSGNFPNPEINFPRYKAFVYDQIQNLQKINNLQIEVFLIKGKGITGYLSNFLKLKKEIAKEKYDIIHSHYSLSGLLAILIPKIPKVVTFHGSDINRSSLRFISSLVSILSSHSIFVSKDLRNKIWLKNKKNSVIPCGVDLDLFYPVSKSICRVKEGLENDKKYILFASTFNNKVKNSPLAKKAVALSSFKAELLELKDRSRQEVRCIINAVDVLLLTSFSEGSPQIIKEAMACNCPIVASNVGDVKNIIKGTSNCFITSYDPQDIADRLSLILKTGKRTDGASRIGAFDNRIVTNRVYNVYKKVATIKAKEEAKN